VNTPERRFRDFSTSELLGLRRDCEKDLRRKEEERSRFSNVAGEPAGDFQEFLTQLRAIQDHLGEIEDELKYRRDARARKRGQQARPNE